MQLIHFRSGANGFYIPCVINDALYEQVAGTNQIIHLYAVSRNFQTTQQGQDDAWATALDYAERVKNTLRTYGVSDTCIAYWSDLNDDYNKFGLFTFPDYATTAGDYPIYPSGTQYATSNYEPLHVSAHDAHCRYSYPAWSSETAGPVYKAIHTPAAAGFIGYGSDEFSFYVFPSSIVKGGYIDDSDLPQFVYTVTITASVSCREYMTSEGYRMVSTGDVSLSASTNVDLKNWISNYLDGADLITTDNPFEKGGTMDNTPVPGSMFTGQGGGGSFTRTNDPIPFPSLPAISAVDTGMLTLYVGSASDMHNLANYLWSGLFDPDTFKKLFASPMEAIIGASIIPVTPPSMPATILFGNVDTQVPMNRATSQYVIIDCGSVPLAEYWGAYLDYSPFTKIHIYLPYIGYKEINVDEVMGKTLSVKYMVDCLSGAIYAAVMANDKVLYQYSGSCAVQVPLTANNWGQAIGSIIQVAGQAIGGYMAGGPAGAILSGGTSLVSNAVSGNLKPEIQRNGSVTGSGGVMAVQKPYIVLEAPRQSMPANYNKFEGFPANVTLVLATCKGFTQIEEINLDGIPASQPELAEIESILKSGVIF